MTPEQRAKKVCEELKGASYDPTEWIEATAPDVLDAITAAILSAENEALDSAIKVCGAQKPKDTSDRENEWASIKLQDAINEIRMMKH